jgi:hypothetical protein
MLSGYQFVFRLTFKMAILVGWLKGAGSTGAELAEVGNPQKSSGTGMSVSM